MRSPLSLHVFTRHNPPLNHPRILPNSYTCRVARLALGLFRLSKLGMDKFWPCFSVGMGPFGRTWGSKFRRGTDAAPQFRSPFLVWDLPFFLGVKKHQSVSIRKTISIMLWVDPKYMLFNTSCFKNLLLTEGKEHIAQMHISFEILAPLFFTVFSTICGTVVWRERKNTGIEIGFSGPLGRFWGWWVSKFSVRDKCNKTAGFTTCCLSLWCRRYLWRVSSSRSCCDKFQTRSHFLSKELENHCFWPLFRALSTSSSFTTDPLGFLFCFDLLGVGGIVAQEETHNRHPCRTDKLWASTTRMPGDVNFSLCKRGRLPYSDKQRKEKRSKQNYNSSFSTFWLICSVQTVAALPRWEGIEKCCNKEQLSTRPRQVARGPGSY